MRLGVTHSHTNRESDSPLVCRANLEHELPERVLESEDERTHAEAKTRTDVQLLISASAESCVRLWNLQSTSVCSRSEAIGLCSVKATAQSSPRRTLSLFLATPKLQIGNDCAARSEREPHRRAQALRRPRRHRAIAEFLSVGHGSNFNRQPIWPSLLWLSPRKLLHSESNGRL